MKAPGALTSTTSSRGKPGKPSNPPAASKVVASTSAASSAPVRPTPTASVRSGAQSAASSSKRKAASEVEKRDSKASRVKLESEDEDALLADLREMSPVDEGDLELLLPVRGQATEFEGKKEIKPPTKEPEKKKGQVGGTSGISSASVKPSEVQVASSEVEAKSSEDSDLSQRSSESLLEKMEVYRESGRDLLNMADRHQKLAQDSHITKEQMDKAWMKYVMALPSGIGHEVERQREKRDKEALRLSCKLAMEIEKKGKKNGK